MNKYYYSIHSAYNWKVEDYNFVIAICPIDWWNESKCLPPEYDEILTDPPEGYYFTFAYEEMVWVTRKNKEDIQDDLTSLGFIKNEEMEKWLESLL